MGPPWAPPAPESVDGGWAGHGPFREPGVSRGAAALRAPVASCGEEIQRGGGQETPGSGADAGPPASPLPSRSPSPGRGPPHGCHLDHVSCTVSDSPLFLLLHPTHPCLADQGLSLLSLPVLRPSSTPHPFACSPEMPGAPSRSQGEAQPCTLHTGRASGSTSPATPKPSRDGNLGNMQRPRPRRVRVGPWNPLASQAALPTGPRWCRSFPDRETEPGGSRGQSWAWDPGLPPRCQAFPHPGASSSLWRAGTLFLHKHLSGYQSAPATWEPKGPVVLEREWPGVPV